MRHTLVLALLTGVLCVPAAALADHVDRDGTLAVRNATGMVAVTARGTLFGHCDRCTVVITDPDPTDGRPPVVPPLSVVGVQLSDTRTRYSRNDLRCGSIGGVLRAKPSGTGL